MFIQRVSFRAFRLTWVFVLCSLSALAEAQVTVSPTSLSFGTINLGESHSLKAVLRNLSSTPVSVLSYSVAGSATDFAVTSTANALPFEIYRLVYEDGSVEEQSLEFTVRFSPSTTGSLTATLNISLTGGLTKTVSLQGAGSTTCGTVSAVASGGGRISNGAVSLLQGSGGTQCTWSPVVGITDANSCTTLAAPTATTVYGLTVIDAAGCASNNEATVEVEVVDITPSAAGSVLLQVKGTGTAPSGYTYLGTSTISFGNGKTKTTIEVDVYRKN